MRSRRCCSRATRRALVDGVGRAETIGIGVERCNEDGEVVVVAECFGEPVELVDQRLRSCSARPRASRRIWYQRCFTDLRHSCMCLVGGVVVCCAQRTTSAAVGGVEALGDRIESTADLPVERVLPGLDEQLAGDDDPFVAGFDRIGRFCGEGGLVVADRPETIVEVVCAAGGCRAWRGAHARRASPRVGWPRRERFGRRVGIVAERRLGKSGEPTCLLAALADVVHGSLDVGRAGEHCVELFDRVIEALGRDAANLAPHGHPGIEAGMPSHPVKPSDGAGSNVTFRRDDRP